MSETIQLSDVVYDTPTKLPDMDYPPLVKPIPPMPPAIPATPATPVVPEPRIAPKTKE